MIFPEQFELRLVAAASFLMAWPTYYYLKKMDFQIVTRKGVLLFFAVWGTIVVAEYFVLGPYSFVERSSGSGNAAFQNFLANRHSSGVFSHQFAGGQDLGIVLPGLDIFRIDRFVSNFAPIWLSILAHKIMVFIIGFWGVYLLSFHFSQGNKLTSCVVAAIYPLSHLYLQHFSIEFGTGFAVIPLAVYVNVVRSNSQRYYLNLFMVGILVAMAEPMKVFPALLVATVGMVILCHQLSFVRIGIGFLVFVIMSVLNWHEVLLSLFQYSHLTTRGAGAQFDSISLFDSFASVPLLFISYWVPTLALVCGILILGLNRDPFFKRVIIVAVVFVFAFLLADAFPWQWIGMPFLNRVEHLYMRMALGALSLPVLAYSVARSPIIMKNSAVYRSVSVNTNLVILAFAVSLMLWQKGFVAANLIAFGGQNNMFGFKELESNDWKPNNDFRVVTLFDTPHPNVTAGFYGIESYDGSIQLNPSAWNSYWQTIRREKIRPVRAATRTSIDRKYWNGNQFEIDKFLRLRLLGISNVRYLLSSLPLKSDLLEIVRVVLPGDRIQIPQSNFANKLDYLKFRISRIFDPGKHFIYKLRESLPRVFPARDLIRVQQNMDLKHIHSLIETKAYSRTAIVNENDANRIRVSDKLLVKNYSKLDDGYDVNLSAPDGGLLVINNVLTPFWHVLVDGHKVEAIQANAIHFAIPIHPGAEFVSVRYRRPTMRQILSATGD